MYVNVNWFSTSVDGIPTVGLGNGIVLTLAVVVLRARSAKPRQRTRGRQTQKRDDDQRQQALLPRPQGEQSGKIPQGELEITRKKTQMYYFFLIFFLSCLPPQPGAPINQFIQLNLTSFTCLKVRLSLAAVKNIFKHNL